MVERMRVGGRIKEKSGDRMREKNRRRKKTNKVSFKSSDLKVNLKDMVVFRGNISRLFTEMFSNNCRIKIPWKKMGV